METLEQSTARAARRGPKRFASVRSLLIAVALISVTIGLQAATFEVQQTATTPVNLQSPNGLPISSTPGVPPGSNGEAPNPITTPNVLPGTPRQFQSAVVFGALAAPGYTNLVLDETFGNYAQNAGVNQLDLPRGEVDGTVVVVQEAARVGAPYLGRSFTLSFGSEIPVPDTDENGILLTLPESNNTEGLTKEEYWLAEPHAVPDTPDRWYWSPHKRAVFAIAPGPLEITWKKSVSTVGLPNGADPNNYTNVNGNFFRLHTVSHIVSGSPAKTPQKIYWTEGEAGKLGKVVQVPTARVDEIKFVYTRNFPPTVDEDEVYVHPGETHPADGNVDPDGMPIGRLFQQKTLWRDGSGIHAYNKQGRVLIELLGDSLGNGNRVHLGVEIVDVIRQPSPADVTTELGELLSAYPEGSSNDDSDLFPEPILQIGQDFAFRFNANGSSRSVFYATRETRNRNDYHLHWMKEGLEGLKWPFRFVRYKMVWPDKVADYSHYVRPLVATEAEAMETAVALPTENGPIIEYQDEPDNPRGKLTDTFAFYTWLREDFPVHRSLLRFSSGENVRFERVLSWLDKNLKSQTFANTIAANLTGIDELSNDPSSFAVSVPRVVDGTVDVGERISAPAGESGGAGTNHLAGYILQSKGTSFNPEAYINPFTEGFEAANVGAIIPVNAIPGADSLEVWWFRTNSVDFAQGFKTVYWPTVIGRYALQWPTNSGEIVLASNDGSGPLPSLQASGKIYFQNDASAVGYNPNEEHALMQGGQAFALRDDLNLISTSIPAVLQSPGATYSSEAYVLLSYTESDGRPAMRPFKVLREKGPVTFDYEIEAGTVLQPPMPLPLLEKPIAPRLAGQPPNTLNTEVGFWTISESTPSTANGLTTWVLTTEDRHFVRPFRAVALQDKTAPTDLDWFYSTNVTSTTLQGWRSDRRPYALTAPSAVPSDPMKWKFETDTTGLAANDQVFLLNPMDGGDWVVTVTALDSTSVTLEFTGSVPESAKGASVAVQLKDGGSENMFADWRMAYEPLPPAITDTDLQAFYASFTLEDRKGNVWIYRGPHSPAEDPSMVMQYYYKTLPGFFFPSLALNAQPPVRTITPYLRSIDTTDGSYIGHPVYGNQVNPQLGDDNPLGITYRPVWPAEAPVLQMAETLLTPKRSLPAVRGQTSLEIVYQQSQVDGGQDRNAVTLHDPTREKTFALDEPDGEDLFEIPSSIQTQTYQGKTYFPRLPPHLAERFFFDPNRSEFGELVFKGEFVDASLGDKYVLLNVLGTNDLKTLKELAKDAETSEKADWETAIGELSTKLELFIENPAQPGTYIPSSPVDIGPGELAEVTNDDVAVDSYGLSATGPGIGYVSFIAGNGRAFTPEGEPASVQIIRVVDTLYRGEVNIVESSNPLNDKLTMQQVVDLAGKTEDYNFEWKIAAPVDGLPPDVYKNTRQEVFGTGSWDHLPFPVETDTAATAPGAGSHRIMKNDVTARVVPLTLLSTDAPELKDGKFHFTVVSHTLIAGNQVTIRTDEGVEVFGTVHGFTTPTTIVVEEDPNQGVSAEPENIVSLSERIVLGRPQSIVFRKFMIDPSVTYSQYWLSLDLDPAVGAKVYLDGQLTISANTGAGQSTPRTPPKSLDPVLGSTYLLSAADLAGGTSGQHTIAVELFSGALPNASLSFDARLLAFTAEDVTDDQWLPREAPDGVRMVMGGDSDVQSLGDNYVIMRYQAKDSLHASYAPDPTDSAINTAWSQWTTPQLAEGWIKRVLKGINPFNQRVTDLFNNAINTDVSILAQAGERWEGDVALNLDTINDTGLIAIYETVLGRGKDLSIGAGINYGPANDALLLAAGYINDLYTIVGNEAFADAANPTIGIGTQNNTYGDIATALFSFRGQLPSLLEEELALLRGRDDFLQPGVELRPVYNRMIWNYTRGIDAGEVIYSLNYNVLDQNEDGKIDADDARLLYPQGHGDAYGHYLMAIKGYYSLLLDPNFDWVPRIEAVTVLGKPVSVDYQDERKFAAAASSIARTGRQIFDLTWRRDYKSGTGNGWEHLSETKENSTTRSSPVTRYWGADHWASRTGQGSYFNWIVGNAILPSVDPNPDHFGGIQQVDRTTVPELKELAVVGGGLQTAMDSAENGLTPLGIPDSTIPFDLNPSAVLSSSTHFEQIYQRAKKALNNAVVAFDDAKDVTRLMRSEEDSLAGFRTGVNKQELAYTNQLIELYGSPYPDDIGPGKTYRTGYTGPDLLHYMYVETPETETGLLNPREPYEIRIDTQSFRAGWVDDGKSDFGFINKARVDGVDGPLDANYEANEQDSIAFSLSPHGFFEKPEEWNGRRTSPGQIQQAISDIIKARNATYAAVYNIEAAKGDLDWALAEFERTVVSHDRVREVQTQMFAIEKSLAGAKFASELVFDTIEVAKEALSDAAEAAKDAIPKNFIIGLAAGGDVLAAARLAVALGGLSGEATLNASKLAKSYVLKSLTYASKTALSSMEFDLIQPEEWDQELRGATSELRDMVYGVQNILPVLNQRLQELDDAKRRYQALLAKGDRIQIERQIFRQRSAAVIQGFRTRDAGFRIFRNEKLERYKSLFDLASQYAFMAAQAYDYETGLLHTEQGREFIDRIIRSRALGVIQNGEPQFAGSNTGDPGLSSAMAEMFGDWSVVKSRLGFNNPDAYGTTVSLRTEMLRILPGTNHVYNWKNVLNQARVDNLLDDSDVRRYCLQIDAGDGLPVPGIVLEFSTTIAHGLNLFGHPLAAGDHAFNPASFATKIFSAGVALEGYLGMDDPAANSGAVSGSGSESPDDPDLAFLDPAMLSATPYIYLIPVGVDSMRSPPLGDESVVRTWSVDDVAIPLPFNIGGSDFSDAQLYQSSDSLSEEPFAIRKHQSFRPISSAELFDPSIYTGRGDLQRSEYTSNRLIGRSVWNSRWKLVIPGRTLLNNPDEGLERFIRSVRDVKLHFVTYSYSGN